MRVLIVTIALLLCCPLGIVFSEAEWNWEDLAGLIGQSIESKPFRIFISKAGSMKMHSLDNKREYHFASQGIYFDAVDDKIVGLTLQIAPGKQIADTQYHGSLPFAVKKIQISPEKAIEQLGEPTARRGTSLVYTFKGYSVTLEYYPQLDYVRIHK